MTSRQRRIYSQNIVDTISSLDNDSSSITGQTENSMNDLTDSSKDDFIVREKLVSILKDYASTKSELMELGGYTLNYKDFNEQIQIMNVSSVNYGQYVYGRPNRYIEDCPAIYDIWLKKYGESKRADTFKSDKFYGNDKVSPDETDSTFNTNLLPILYLKEPTGNEGAINKISAYKWSIDTGQFLGVEYSSNAKGITVNGTWQFSYNYSESYSSYYKDNFVGKLVNNSVVYAYTKDKSKSLLVRVNSGEGKVTTSYPSVSSCPSGYNPPTIYNYSFNISFTPVEDVPYYTVEVPYTSNGVTKYRTEKRYYEFFPFMKSSLDSAFELRLINRIRTLQYETIDFLRRGTSDEAVYQKYTKYLNIYATNVNASNKNIVYNNFDNLASFFRARLASCRQTLSDSLMAKEMNEAFDERMNKAGGTLKQWYEGAVSIDKMEEDFKNKIKRKKTVFSKMLVQAPAQEFDGGSEMIIDDKCSGYYVTAIGRSPTFNVGDIVYIMDEEHNETMCSIVKKQRVSIDDTADVQYETVKKEDGTTEQVAKTDNNGEPITIYTYKNAWKLTFNGNVPKIYDIDTVRLIKEL